MNKHLKKLEPGDQLDFQSNGGYLPCYCLDDVSGKIVFIAMIAEHFYQAMMRSYCSGSYWAASITCGIPYKTKSLHFDEIDHSIICRVEMFVHPDLMTGRRM
ncbi:MAG: hypothetical protein WC227_01585 [Patescibacteria group bacterium]|jgi:hypothetical protein